MHRVATTRSPAGRLKQTTTIQTRSGFDFDSAKAHEPPRLVLLLDLFDNRNRQELDFVSYNSILS